MKAAMAQVFQNPIADGIKSRREGVGLVCASRQGGEGEGEEWVWLDVLNSSTSI